MCVSVDGWDVHIRLLRFLSVFIHSIESIHRIASSKKAWIIPCVYATLCRTEYMQTVWIFFQSLIRRAIYDTVNSLPPYSSPHLYIFFFCSFRRGFFFSLSLYFKTIFIQTIPTLLSIQTSFVASPSFVSRLRTSMYICVCIYLMEGFTHAINISSEI